MIEIGLRIPACAPSTEVARFIGRAEAAGFSDVALPDTQLLVRDPYITLALATQCTKRVVLSVAVTNPITRHVSVLACLARTIEELAPGRMRVIMGKGDSSVKNVDLKGATLAEIRHATTTLQRLLSGDSVTFGAQTARLTFASGRGVPVYSAATGPRSLQLAGEIGDGVLIQVANVPHARAIAWSEVAAGAKLAGRDPASLDVIWGIVPTIVSSNMEDAWARARAYCASWLMMPERAAWLKASGIDLQEYKIPHELTAVYPDIAHAEDIEQVRRLTSFMPDSLVARICDTMGLFGTPEHCAKRLEQMESEGVKKVYLRGMETYSLPEDLLTAFETEVFPRLRRN